MRLKYRLILLSEKALWTAVEVGATVLLLSDELNAGALQAGAVASVSAVITVIINAIMDMGDGQDNLTKFQDLIVRTVRTVAVTGLTFLASTPFVDWTWTGLYGAIALTAPGLITLIKGFASLRVGNHNSAATLPFSLDVQSHVVVKDNE